MKIAVLFLISFLLSSSFGGCKTDVSSSGNNTTVNVTSNITQTKPKEDKETLKSDEGTKIKENENFKFNNEGIPILMYHSVKYEKDNSVRIAEERFREQMKYLKDNGYTTLTLDEAYAFFQSNTPVPKKSVVLTFDDGYVDNFTTAYPILKEFGFKATIFVITNVIGQGEYLSEAQIKELDEYGLDIQSHTVNHENLSELSYDKQLATLKNSKEFLQKLLDKQIKYIAYPFGKYNKDTVKAVEAAGYDLALTTAGKWSDKADGIYTLDRVYISGFHDMETFKNRISNPEYSIQ